MNDESQLNIRDEEQARRVAWLISGFLRQSLSEAELDELDAWIVASDENQLLFEELTDTKNIEAGIHKLKGIDTEAALNRIKKQIGLKKDPVPPKRSNRIWTYTIAASLLLLLGLFIFNKLNKHEEQSPVTQLTPGDLQPGGNKATLTLADGNTIDLAEQKNGIIKNENGTQINKTAEGQLTYSSNAAATELKYNKLSTPRGGQYKIVLPDGTTAWLNAASSLKYPLSFTGSERVVELTGEGFFEVAKNASQPFKVRLKNDVVVEVTGTSFNINAYDDETNLVTTLLEGAVNISNKNSSTKLLPGEQAIVQHTGEIKTRKDPQVAEVIAWKQGKFDFKEATIETIMRQVARWYDVDIQYQGKVNYHFKATIPRSVTASKLFKLLEMTGNVHFEIKDKKIIVKP